MKKRTVVLLTFFILLVLSGVVLFRFSTLGAGGDQLNMDPVGIIHASIAFIVIILVMLHVRGNIKMLKNLREEYEDKIKTLKEDHKIELEKLSKAN